MGYNSSINKLNVNMKKIIFAFISILIVSLLITSYQTTNASGGKTKECNDANVKGYEGGSKKSTYKTNNNGIVNGVCIKSGSGMFGDMHSEKLTSNDTYESCYKVQGLGTDKLVVEKIKEGNDCKDISHIDVYTSEKQNEDTDEEEDENSDENNENEDPAEDNEESEDSEENLEEDSDNNDEQIGGLIVEGNNNQNNNNDDNTSNEEDNDDENGENDENSSEEIDEEVLGAITELPKTGEPSVNALIGLLMTSTGLILKKK